MECPDVLFGVAGAALWLAWYWSHRRVTRLASGGRDRLVLYLAPAVCAVLLALGLFGAPGIFPDLRDDMLGFCFAFGLLWVGLASWLTPFLGLSARDDVAERRNRAAAWAVGGAQVGVTLCYAGAVLRTAPAHDLDFGTFAGLAGTLALFLCWGVLEWLTGLSELITVERDGAAGARLATFLAAAGTLLGQAAADLRSRLVVWLVLPPGFLGAALALEWWCQRGRSPRGAAFGVAKWRCRCCTWWRPVSACWW